MWFAMKIDDDEEEERRLNDMTTTKKEKNDDDKDNERSSQPSSSQQFGLPKLMLCSASAIRVVLWIPPHRRHPRIRTAVPRTSSSDTDTIARSDDSRGSSDPATSTASAPPAVPRTSSSDTVTDPRTMVPRTTDLILAQYS